MRILAAVDGSEFTKRMLGYLAAHDEWLGPQHEYTVIHSVPAVPSRAAAALDRVVLKRYYDDESDKVFKPIRTFFERQGMKAKFVGKVGVAADEIVALAGKGHFDLIVLGSHGHGALGSLVLGSVTSKVLAHTTVPVLIVR